MIFRNINIKFSSNVWYLDPNKQNAPWGPTGSTSKICSPNIHVIHIPIYLRCIRLGDITGSWPKTRMKHGRKTWSKQKGAPFIRVFCAKRLSQTEYLGNIWEVSDPSPWSIIVPNTVPTVQQRAANTPENINLYGPSMVSSDWQIGPNRTAHGSSPETSDVNMSAWVRNLSL